MIKFEDAEILDILPSSLADDVEVKALSAASKALNQLLYKNILRLYIYANLDLCQENVLDYLSRELHAQYYDDTLLIETKRELIKKTLDWHIAAGTPAAVEQLIETVFGAGEVNEWWNFADGAKKPFEFDIMSSARFTESTFKEISRMIKNAKNVRSHLRKITTSRDIENEQNALSGATESPGHVIIYAPTVESEVSNANIEFSAAVIESKSVIRDVPEYSEKIRQNKSFLSGAVTECKIAIK